MNKNICQTAAGHRWLCNSICMYGSFLEAFIQQLMITDPSSDLTSSQQRNMVDRVCPWIISQTGHLQSELQIQISSAGHTWKTIVVSLSYCVIIITTWDISNTNPSLNHYWILQHSHFSHKYPHSVHRGIRKIHIWIWLRMCRLLHESPRVSRSTVTRQNSEPLWVTVLRVCSPNHYIQNKQ